MSLTRARDRGASSSSTTSKGPCLKCDLEVKSTGEGVPCSLCEYWTHTKCVKGITSDFIENHDGIMRLSGGSGYLHPGCRKAISKLNVNLKEQAAKVGDLEKDADHAELERKAMKEKMDRLEAQLDQVRAQMVALQKEMEDGMEKAVKVVKEEVNVERRQMEEKASNIVLYGLVEAEGDDAKERKEKDEENVKKIAQAIGVEIAGSIDAKYRAGKRIQGAKPRPLIVTVDDDETRISLLKRAPLLSRATEWKGVFIWEDMTKKQREENNKREAELRLERDRKNDEAKNDGKTGGSYRIKGRGEGRRVVWWWDSRERTE